MPTLPQTLTHLHHHLHIPKTPTPLPTNTTTKTRLIHPNNIKRIQQRILPTSLSTGLALESIEANRYKNNK